ncbi:MAG: hypothetical protein HC797_06350 [Anaerolineales bacterium]|nr:hypothetical protein [Anaerolineales bacterium]
MKSENPSNRKTYYRKSQFNSFVFFVMLLIFVVLTKAPMPLVIMLSFFALLTAYSAIQIRLVVSPEGVEYYQVGYSVKTTWDNVARVGEIPAGRIMAEGLILYQPALFVDSWACWRKIYTNTWQINSFVAFQTRLVRKRTWTGHKKYAPHLFARK